MFMLPKSAKIAKNSRFRPQAAFLPEALFRQLKQLLKW
jgi:hypothetical protein